MALVSKRKVPGGFIAVWMRDESSEQLLQRLELSPEETEYAGRITTEHRRKEWLTWHVMLRELLGAGVTADYDESGAPVLRNHEGHISISHSGDYVVLYYNRQRCGIDIEDSGRDFGNVRSRVVTDAEAALAIGEPDNRFLSLVWCTKEAVYKYAGIRGLDYLKEIALTAIDIPGGMVTVRIRDEKTIRLRYEFIKGYCLVYTLVD